jgi:hypothetical protein
MPAAVRKKKLGDPDRPNALAPKAPRKKVSRKGKPKKAKKPNGPPTHAERVEAITYMMAKADWIPKVSVYELATKWDCSPTAVAKAADHASVKLRMAEGNLERVIMQSAAELDDIKKAAMEAGQFNAAVRAVEVKSRLLGVFVRHQPGRVGVNTEEEPRGLPPELAQLSPPPSVEEVEHFASVAPEACEFEPCRVHGKATARPAEIH